MISHRAKEGPVNWGQSVLTAEVGMNHRDTESTARPRRNGLMDWWMKLMRFVALKKILAACEQFGLLQYSAATPQRINGLVD